MNNVRMVRSKLSIYSRIDVSSGLTIEIGKNTHHLTFNDVQVLQDLLNTHKQAVLTKYAKASDKKDATTVDTAPLVIESEDLERTLVSNLPPSKVLGEKRYLVVANFKPEDTESQPYLVVQWFGQQMGWKFVGYGPY